jgi:membrane protein YdbS with pleckstrin-like domain
MTRIIGSFDFLMLQCPTAIQYGGIVMSKYIDDSLNTGETVKYTARVSLWRYSFHFLIGAALALISLRGLVGSTQWLHSVSTALLIVALVVLVSPFIARSATELVITNKRLIAKYGLVTTHSIEIRFDKIETVRVSQGLLGRILNFGDIIVTGTGSTFDPIRGIAGATRFRTELNQAMDPGEPPASSAPSGT